MKIVLTESEIVEIIKDYLRTIKDKPVKKDGIKFTGFSNDNSYRTVVTDVEFEGELT